MNERHENPQCDSADKEYALADGRASASWSDPTEPSCGSTATVRRQAQEYVIWHVPWRWTEGRARQAP